MNVHVPTWEEGVVPCHVLDLRTPGIIRRFSKAFMAIISTPRQLASRIDSAKNKTSIAHAHLRSEASRTVHATGRVELD